MAIAKPPATFKGYVGRGRRGWDDDRYENWDWLQELGQQMIEEGMAPHEIQAISQGLAQLATVITGMVLEDRGRARNKKLYGETDGD